ncbi:hypothetical protein DBR42_17045 [Pelomonas sp. HMWF004]|nr:hypothetical protein DBR42_17045 [Pelomonas sp. HMWF004]
MTPAPGQAPREGAVDALRAAALLPVVAVNWVGYAYLPDAGPLGPAQPAGSILAQAVVWLVAALLACKGLALLAFLFGYSQGLSRRARGDEALAVRRRRMWRLMALGVLHGLLLYAGDILTLYALCGLLMLGWSRLPLRRLRQRAAWLLAWQAVLFVVLALLMLFLDAPEASSAAVSLATTSDVGSWLLANGRSYLVSVLATATLGVMLPLGLMTAGLVSARLRLFSHPRWRPLLRRWGHRWLWPGLLLNMAWATGLCWGYHGGSPSTAELLYSLGLFVAMPLLMGVVPRLVLAAQQPSRVMHMLARAGRHTLSLYIGSSLLSFALFSGLGLAWSPGTVALAGLTLLYWGGWVLLSSRWRGRLPLETWLSR